MTRNQLKEMIWKYRSEIISKNPKVENLDLEELYKFYFFEESIDTPLSSESSHVGFEIRIKSSVKHLLPERFYIED